MAAPLGAKLVQAADTETEWTANMKALIALVGALIALAALSSPASAIPGYSIQPLGLRDAEHTDNSGHRSNTVTELNDAGHIVGLSSRFNGISYVGESAWLYDGNSTIKLGLVDAEHTRIDGYKEQPPCEFSPPAY